MTTDEKQPERAEWAKLKRLLAAIEQGRRSGISDHNAGEIPAEAKANLRRPKGGISVA